jgi:hypothetical protein
MACPDADSLKSGISAKLGANPFVDGGGIGIKATIEHTEAGWSASVQREEAATSIGGQKLHSDSPDCHEISEALEFAISLMLDALRPPPPRQPVRAAPPPTELKASGEPEKSQGPTALVGVGFASTFGATPSPAPGVAFVADVRWNRFSLELEGFVSIPTTTQLSENQVQSSLYYGALVPCWRLSPFGVCGVLDLGTARTSADGGPAADTFFAAAGARGYFDLDLGQHFMLRATIDLLASMTQNALVLNGVTAWNPPPIAASAGLIAGIPFL